MYPKGPNTNWLMSKCTMINFYNLNRRFSHLFLLIHQINLLILKFDSFDHYYDFLTKK